MFDKMNKDRKELAIPVIYAIINQHKGKILKFILSQFRKEFAIPVIIVIRATAKGKFESSY